MCNDVCKYAKSRDICVLSVKYSIFYFIILLLLLYYTIVYRASDKLRLGIYTGLFSLHYVYIGA